MPKFFRIEFRDDRRGAYSRYSALSIISSSGVPTNDVPTHPIPESDSLLSSNCKKKGVSPTHVKWSGEWRFGFSSLKQLKAWFYNDQVLSGLKREGAVLSIYLPRSVVRGNCQAVMMAKYHAEKYRLEELELDAI